MKKFFRGTIKFLSLSSAFLLFLAGLSSFVSPENMALPSVLGLISPLIFLFSLFFCFYYFIKKKRFYRSVSLVALAFYFPILLNYFNFKWQKEESYPKEFDILSYNVRQFDHYNWIEADGTSNQLFNFLRTQPSDILCLQEFYHSPYRNFNAVDSLLESGRWNDFVYSPYFVFNKNANSGLIIFSRYEIIANEIILFPNSLNKAIYADIVLFSDTVRVYNVHLESIHFAGIDYDIMNGKIVSGKKLFSRIWSIYSKLIAAFTQRSKQVRILEQCFAQSPYPFIVAGDFNDTPNSYVYSYLSKSLDDSFLASGFGLGKTYVSSFPWLRIDYFFHSELIQSIDFDVCKRELSDHYPLRAVFRVNR